MNSFEKNIKRISDNISLSSEEKMDLKHEFDQFMAKQPEPSPWISQPTFISSTFLKYAVATFSLVLIFQTTAIQAEKTVPGDFLYPIKTNVNENVMQLFSFTPEQKAKTHINISDRRLDELEQLIVSEKLNPETAEIINKEMDQHTDAAFSHIEEISIGGKTKVAAEVSEQLEVILDSHTEEIATIDDTATIETKSLLEEVHTDLTEDLAKAQEISEKHQEELEEIQNEDADTSTTTPETEQPDVRETPVEKSITPIE